MLNRKEFALATFASFELIRAGHSAYKALETGEQFVPGLSLSEYATNPLGHFLRGFCPPEYQASGEQFYMNLGTEALILALITSAIAYRSFSKRLQED